MARVRHDRRLGVSYHLFIALLRPFALLLTKRDWHGAEHLEPVADGVGIIVCPNHISWFDPLQSAHFLYDNGRPPRYLAKESMFRIPLIGSLLRRAGQIPVYRESVAAASSLRDAVAAVKAGECVVVYPEGTITRDPDLWPMTGKTGAARLALETGAPLVPLGQWGAQAVIPPYGNRFYLLPRKTMKVLAGPAIDLSDLRGLPVDAATLAIATDRLMAAITDNVALLRRQVAPAVRYDPRTHGPSSTAEEAA